MLFSTAQLQVFFSPFGLKQLFVGSLAKFVAEESIGAQGTFFCSSFAKNCLTSIISLSEVARTESKKRSIKSVKQSYMVQKTLVYWMRNFWKPL